MLVDQKCSVWHLHSSDHDHSTQQAETDLLRTGLGKTSPLWDAIQAGLITGPSNPNWYSLYICIWFSPEVTILSVTLANHHLIREKDSSIYTQSEGVSQILLPRAYNLTVSVCGQKRRWSVVLTQALLLLALFTCPSLILSSAAPWNPGVTHPLKG